MNAVVARAGIDDLDALAPLFDAYRHFYTGRREPEASRAFLAERLRLDESAVFGARVDGTMAGFTQLYPMFSSVHARRTWILNDLYVDPAARRRGLARALLEAAAEFARARGAIRLELETDHDNRTAQALYDALGWSRYDDTRRYHLALERP